jgi:hypothetical protein
MTIGLIDPALLLSRDSDVVLTEVNMVLSICKTHEIRLVPYTEYWTELWRTLGRSLESSLTPAARLAIQELRKSADRYKGLAVQTQGGGTWCCMEKRV